MKKKDTLGYSAKSLAMLNKGTYGTTTGRQAKYTTSQEQTRQAKELPMLKEMKKTAAPNKATEMVNNPVQNQNLKHPKPSTRYNQNVNTQEQKSTRDTRYDKDFDTFFNYRLGDFSGEVDYDPVQDADVEKWRNVKKDIMAKNKWSENEFDSRWDEYINERNQKAANAEVQSGVDVAKKNPVFGTLLQAAYTPQNMIEGGAAMLSNLAPEKYKAQSADDTLFTGTRTKEGIKQTVKDEHIKSKVGKGAYDIGTSLADMVMASAVPGLGVASLGTQAAARQNMQALERGVDPNKAALTGAASGVISGLMNKVGLDKALGAAGKTALGTVGKAAVREGLENVVEDVANYGVDAAINRNKSQLNTLHDYYVNEGMSSDDAWSQVIKDTGLDLTTSALSGAAFGGVMSGMRNIPALTKEIGDIAKRVNIDNKGGVDAPALIEEARKAMKAPAKVDNKLQFSPVEGELRNRLQAEFDDNAQKISENESQINALKALEQNASRKDRKAYEKQRTALEKENRTLSGQQPTLKNLLDGYESTYKEELSKEDRSHIFDERNGGVYNMINLGAKFAGETPEAKALAKEAKSLLSAYVESGNSEDYFNALGKIAELSGLADASRTDYVTKKGNKYSYEDVFNNPTEDAIGQPRQETLYDRVDDGAIPKIVNDIHQRFDTEEGYNDGQLTPQEVQRLQEGLAEDEANYPGEYPVNEVPAEAPTEPTEAPKAPEVVPPVNEPPLTSEPPRTDKEGISKVGTNTMVNSKVYTKDQIENDPVISEINKYAKANNDQTFNAAKENIYKDGATLLDEYTSGKRAITNDLDVDQAMILLTDMSNKIKAGDEGLEAQRNLLFSRLRQAGTLYGQTIQAFKKWNNTAEGAIINGERIIDDTVKPWKTNNKKKVELNARIAKALEQMGVDSSMRNKPQAEKTHEQVKQGVRNVLEREFGSVEQYFDDNDIEYLARLAEEKSVPTWKITDEIEHKLSTGEWYTLDESTPVKKAFSSKLNTILKNMGNDSLKESNKQLDNGYPKKSHATIVEEVKNSLEKEMAGIGLDKPTDIEFLATLIEERVPNWQIEDEIAHRLETGEWYTLDESTQPKYPVNQKLKNALDDLIKQEPTVKEPPTLDEIKNEVRTTLDKEMARVGEFTDDDVDYLSNLIYNGATKQELSEALNTKMATGRFGISDETQRQVSDLFAYANRFDPDSKQAFDLKTAAYKLIAEEAVSDNATPFEKFESWRYLAMLGNPKTMMRNFIGNKMFGAVTGVSNNLSAALEAGTDRLSRALGGEGIQRTKTFLNPVDDRALIKAAAEDGEAHRYSELSGSKYEKGTKDAIKQQKSVFNSKLLRLYEAATDRGISDYNAVKKKYSTSLAGYMKANGLDESAFDANDRYIALKDKARSQLLTDAERSEMEGLKSTVDMLEKARDYAVKQADYATFHEDNAFAKWLTKTSNSAPAPARMVIEGLVPFKKTPANILRSGFEYSPLGALKSIKETGKLIYENTGNRKGNLEDTYTKKSKLTGKEKEVNKSLAADVLDSWSKTLTGSAIVGLGMYLKDKGIINSSNKDEKWQDDLEGIQNYSITINGKTYTLDWAAPAVMPLLMGAELSKLKDRNGMLDKKWYENLDEVIGTANAILDPIFETSMMQGVKNTLEQAANDIRYNEDGAIGGILGSMALNTGLGYATQALPTLSGQIARTLDNTRRATDTANDGALGVLEKQGRKLMNKVPGLSRLNQPYYDSYGRTQQNSPFNNLLGNMAYQMLSPAYIRDINTTAADESARKAYYSKNEEGKPIMDSKVFPSWKSQVKVGGEKLTPEEMASYRKSSGEAQYAIRDALTKEDWFNKLDGEKQTELLKKVNTLVDKVGKDSVDKLDSSSKDYEAYEAGGVPGLLNKWNSDVAGKKVTEDTGLSGSTNAVKEIKAAYAEGDTKKGDELTEKYTKYNKERERLNAKYGVNITMAKFTEREDANPGSNEEWAKQNSTGTTNNTASTSKVPEVKNTNPDVDISKHEKYINRAGSQAQKYTNDIPKLDELKFSGSEKYTYAYAINQDKSLTPEKFNDQFNKLDLNNNGSMAQDEMINYFNKYKTSESQAQYLWKTYGENKGNPWKAQPVYSNGKWSKKKK